jgi:6-pyruvoyltetrahydropterin/6-carboxytetrahydropterin synthase
MPRAQISKEVEFDAGHRVPAHRSKCRNPHGHRYRVRVTCEGEILPTDNPTSTAGMLVDFADLKEILETLAEKLDHGFIIWKEDEALLRALAPWLWKYYEFPFIPTAENIARWFYNCVERDLGQYANKLAVVEVAVWETPTSVAYFRGGE